MHSVVFGGFAANELAARIDDARPTVIVSASCGIEPTRTVDYKPMLDAALEIAEHAPPVCVILQREQRPCALTAGRDLDWRELVADAEPAEAVPVAATDPLYVLYTSGTTGKPKGIVRDNGGHAVALLWTMRHLYDTDPGDIYWAASDVGWVVGHSYIVYGAAAARRDDRALRGQARRDARCRRVLAGGRRARGQGDVHRADRDPGDQEGGPRRPPARQYDLSSLRYLFQAGERLDPGTYQWASEKLGVPVVDHWWQTETGWAIAGNPMGIEQMRIKPGSATVPMPGYDVRILRPDGSECDPNEEGAICVKLPLPPGTLPTLWGEDDRYVSSYLSAFPDHYLTGDGGYIDEDGYIFVMGRTDDVINVAGHRMSTGSIEAVLAGHPAVAECAVIGVADEIRGQVPRGFVVLKSGATADRLAEELVEAVRQNIGAVACFKQVDVVPALPKTRSGKILRKTMRGIVDGRDEPLPSTIEDPAVIDTLRPILLR